MTTNTRAAVVWTRNPVPPGFGTSGVRGRVPDLTPKLVADYVTAFLTACPIGTGLYLARDLRPSSDWIMTSVRAAARGCGVAVTDCGEQPTPALAMAAQSAGASAIMVTGSHIPADRNGLKFFSADGEIGKSEETAILAALGSTAPPSPPAALHLADPGPAYIGRYLRAFGPRALAGRRIGVWAHSAVGRDLLSSTLRALGAAVVEIDRRDRFVALDTEAINPETRRFLEESTALHGVEAIVSTDGDGDRPLVTDNAGKIVPGDLLGQIAALYLGAKVVVTPLTSNTGVDRLTFDRIVRTRVGAPHVIAAMQAALADDPSVAVVGYEANGGFLLGFAARGPAGPLPALMTRDSVLPIVSALVMAGQRGFGALLSSFPERATATDRLLGIDRTRAQHFVTRLSGNPIARAAFLEGLSETERDHDLSDGLRIVLRSGRVLHLRVSGNAPELRCYTEAGTRDAATALLQSALDALDRALA